MLALLLLLTRLLLLAALLLLTGLLLLAGLLTRLTSTTHHLRNGIGAGHFLPGAEN